MSGQDFTKKTDKIRKELNTLRKDINYRDEQEKRGEATYTLDAEINGQFNSINEELSTVETMANNFKNNFKDYNLTMSEANRRFKVYEQLLNDKNSLKRTYDGLFAKKTAQRELLGNLNAQSPAFEQKYDTKKLTTKELNDLKLKQEQEQDEALDELIHNVKNLKSGGKAIHEELTDQEKLLQTLDNKMDDNIDNMSSARRRMTKLLDSSSNCCLITVMIVEIVLIVVIWVLIPNP